MSASSSTVQHPRECSICWEDLENDVTQLTCQHMYHSECLKMFADKHKERIQEYENFQTNPPQNIDTLDYGDWPSHPGDLSCPVCRKPYNLHEGCVFLEYENRYAKLEPRPNSTEEEKRRMAFRKKRNARRRAQRNRAEAARQAERDTAENTNG